MIAILSQGTTVNEVTTRLMEMLGDSLTAKKYEMTVIFSKQTGVDNNRNIIAKHFLTTNCKFLIMMDEDNPPITNPFRVVDLNKDVVSLPTPMYKGDKIPYNVFKKKSKNSWETIVDNAGSKLVKADRVGTGCIVIKRRVLENIKAPFLDKKNSDGIRILGEDMLFSDKVWKAGYTIWVHWGHTCSHYKTLDLVGVQNLMINKQKKL